MLNKYTKDVSFLENAVNLGKKAAKLSSPNPGVGCLIVKNDEIISYGHTSIGGRPHAEQNAIKKVSNSEILHGATIYASLEPCFHKGQTEPCVDLIIANKIARVVIAAIDPDHRVTGKSIAKLQENNIAVEVINLESAKQLYRSYFKNRNHNLPYVTAKIAVSKDGMSAYKNKNQQWITTPQSRKNGHLLRFSNDAILIGKNTLIQDNPSLDCRIKGLEKYSPTIIVLANKIDFDNNYQIFKNNTAPKIIFYQDNQYNQQQVKNFSSIDNLQLIAIDEKNGKLDLLQCLNKIHQLQINNLLIEGGSAIISEFLKQNLIDEIYCYQSNNSLKELGKNYIDQNNLRLKKVKNITINDSDELTIYQK